MSLPGARAQCVEVARRNMLPWIHRPLNGSGWSMQSSRAKSASNLSRFALVAALLGLSLPARAATVEHRTAPSHAMQYDVARPSGWKAGASYPIVVVIPDASRAFRENLEAFVAARNDAPVLLVAPYVITSGGPSVPHEVFPYAEATWREIERRGAFTFDEEGLAAVLADVHVRDGGADRVFLTGWEAGGHTVWALALRHPGWFRAVAPVSPNYLGRWPGPAPTEASRPVVRVLFCGVLAGDREKFRQILLRQTRTAIEAARARGFDAIPIEEQPGRPHGPLADVVLSFFRGQLDALKKGNSH